MEVIFNYEGIETTIQCNINYKLEEIINKFLLKINPSGNRLNLIYLYNGEGIHKELKFHEHANELDKSRNKMNVLVDKIDEDKINKNEIISKDVICPICKENILINIDNFKVRLHGCKNNHNIKDILLTLYEDTQKIDLSQIICELCKKNDKSVTHNNDFYICYTCNKNICPLCKSSHDSSHSIINYDDKNYTCKKHSETFIKFCETCKENMCFMCENEHIGHNFFEFSKIIINKTDLLNTMNDLKIALDKFKSKITNEEILNRIKTNVDLYYKINNGIINNYNVKKRNYHKLQNLNYLKDKNEKLIKDLNDIIVEDVIELYTFFFDTFYDNNKEKYLGEKKDGLKNGQGILFYNKDDVYKRRRYEGTFITDILEGKGIMYYNNWDRYEGDFRNNKREGKGVYYYHNGNREIGDYYKGNEIGEHVMITKDGEVQINNY